MKHVRGTLRQTGTLFLFLFALVITVLGASAKEDFTFTAQTAQIPLCIGEQRSVTLQIANTGSYFSQFQITQDDPKQAGWATISDAGFALYPQQEKQSILRFMLPSSVKENTYEYPLSLLTKTGKKKTITFTIDARRCPFSALVQHEPSYTVSACERASIPLTVLPVYMNQSATSVSFTPSFKYAASIRHVTIASEAQNTTLALDLPCNAKGTVPLGIAMHYGSILRNITIPVTIKPHAFQTLTFAYPSYTICDAGKAYLPLTVTNTDEEEHVLALATELRYGFAKFNQTKLVLGPHAQETLSLVINPRPVSAKDGSITVTATDGHGAETKATVNVSFLSQAACEEPTIQVPALDVAVEKNKTTTVPLAISYTSNNHYHQPQEGTYTLRVSPAYSFAHLEDEKVTVDGTTKTRLVLAPAPDAYAAAYPLTLIIASDHSTTRIPLTVTVSGADKGMFWSQDTMLRLLWLYGSYALIGLVAGIIVIIMLLVLLPPPARRKYRIIKRNVKKNIEEETKKEQKTGSTPPPVPGVTAQDVQNASTQEEMRKLLLTIEVEKKAREKIIEDLSEWSKQYASAKKHYKKSESLKLKSQEQRDKEFKDINELLAVQKDSYAKIHAREQQIRKRLEKESRGFWSSLIDFFTPEDKYIPLRDIQDDLQKAKKKKMPTKTQAKNDSEKKQSDEVSRENKRNIRRLRSRRHKGFWASVRDFFIDEE